MSILIGADLVPTAENSPLFTRGDAEALCGAALREILAQADYRIFNLETPLADADTPIAKVGPALRAPTGAVCGMKALGVDLFTLANNHCMDQSAPGLRATLAALRTAGIDTVGAGETAAEAARPHTFVWRGQTVGVYACAEHEFSIAGVQSCGANPFDPLETPDHIARLKQSCDYVIVLYHGGKEYYRYPSPGLQKVCRKLVDKGADLVVCQHSHCIGAYERYGQGCIVYGQGNFLFEDGEGEPLQTGLLVCLGDDLEVSFVPLRRVPGGVRLAEGQDGKTILQALEQRSALLGRPGFVEQNYRAFAQENCDAYLQALNGAAQRSFLYRVLNRVTARKWSAWYLRRHYRPLDRLRLRNYIECEAHRELLLAGLRSEWNSRR